MILVILGAGATYDSDPRRPAPVEDVTRPPLTNDLFEGRFAVLEDHPEGYRLIPRLRDAAARNESIERELEKVRDEARGKQPTLERALIALRAYLGDVIHHAEIRWAGGHHGVTNQLNLLARLEAWREPRNEQVRIVTFNYDRLIERAVQGAIPGLGFGALESFINDERYRVYKLHGSVDWFRQTEIVHEGGDRRIAEKRAQYFRFSQPVQVVGGPRWVRAISIPLATKTDSEFECPVEHLEALRADLPQVKSVICIGWRGAEEHFMRLWAEHHPPKMDGILCVTGSQPTAFRLGQQLTAGIQMGAQMTLRTEGFTRFLEDGTLDTWL